MSTGVRFALIIAIVLAALLGLSLCGYNYWEPTEQKPSVLGYMLASAQSRPEPCMDEQTREKMRGVMLEALDTSLQQHIIRAFEVWMKDDRGQPDRARIGVQNGVQAYLLARKGVLEWMPPPCAG